ncbi:MAG: SUMF1/EgtB/PvdO family nonheme iron enzyme [Hahellaceae bacterium]|nr:SUMF1/EgtB/PvdO family nonheme iron enzyme [Hahellaceae bacterium]
MPQVVRYGLVLICLLGGFTQVWAETRTALVIGNSAYRDAPLKNPANDATDVAKLLRSLEFDVVLKTNATQEAMEDAIRDFGKALEKKGGVGLFFYAGHGVQSQGKNYLIPVDAQLEREKDLRYRAVNLGQLLDEMRFAKNGLNIAILDACRNNPLTRSFRSSERGLAPTTDAPKGLFLAYSTSPNEVAADGEGRNSPFTEQLKLALTKPGLPLELTFKEVVKGVKKVTQEKQVPWFNSSVSGDFYFKPATPAQAPVVTPTIGPSAVPGKAVDALAWTYVENSQDVRDFAAFQKQFPNSQYAFLAKIREQQLQRTSAPAAPVAEKYALTVQATPANAKIRILNIGPAYRDGIQLTPGDYHLEVSARGYEMQREWVSLGNIDLTHRIVLNKTSTSSRATQLGLEFVTIPAGSFMMGSDDGDNDEKPVRKVQVPSFKLMKYEVTQGQWQAVMGSNPSYFSSCGQNCPVENVSWNNVQQFIHKLNQQTGLTFRLPSEAEWEYAARAGTTTAFSFGDQITTEQANFKGNYTYNGSQKGVYLGKTVRVDSFQPNNWGLYNMHGNVSELTEDCWNYFNKDYINSRARSDGDCSLRVLRGGSWANEPRYLRSASRNSFFIGFRDYFAGFRLVQGL